MKAIRKLRKRPDIVQGYVREYRCNRYTVCKAMKSHPRANIKMIGNGLYENLITGEVSECKPKSESKAFSLQSFERTMFKLYLMILANVDDDCKNHYQFITLTYDHAMRDVKQLNKDWASFWTKLSRYVKKEYGVKLEYICVKEPQGNGSFHFHVILIWPNKAQYLDNDNVIARLWGNGFTKTAAVKCRAIQLAEYLTNMAKHMGYEDYIDYAYEWNEDLAIEVGVINEDSGNATKESRMENARIALYPRDMRIFNTSRGVKKPVEREMDYMEFKEDIQKAGKLISEKHIAILETDDEQVQELTDEAFAEQAQQVISTYVFRKWRPVHDPEYARRQKEYQSGKQKNDVPHSPPQ